MCIVPATITGPDDRHPLHLVGAATAPGRPNGSAFENGRDRPMGGAVGTEVAARDREADMMTWTCPFPGERLIRCRTCRLLFWMM